MQRWTDVVAATGLLARLEEQSQLSKRSRHCQRQREAQQQAARARTDLGSLLDEAAGEIDRDFRECVSRMAVGTRARLRLDVHDQQTSITKVEGDARAVEALAQIPAGVLYRLVTGRARAAGPTMDLDIRIDVEGVTMRLGAQ